MSATQFKVGDEVEALDTVQGLRIAHYYRVTAVDTMPTMFGNFVTYHVAEISFVDPDAGVGCSSGANHQEVLGKPFSIANGHLLLKHAAEPKP